MMKKFKFLGLLFVFSLLFTCFGYCDYLNGLQFITNVQYNGNGVYQTTPGLLGFPTDLGLFCYNINNFGGTDRLVISWNGLYSYSIRFQTDRSFGLNLFGCFQKGDGTDNIPVYISSEDFGVISSFDIDFYYIPTSDYEIVSGSPGYTIQQCQSEYGLISPNDVQTEVKFLESEYTSTSYYLGYNKLATINLNGNSYTVSQINGDYTFNIQENQGGQCTGEISTGLSTLYINDIRHESKPFIYVNIPEEFSWDYSVGINDFTIDVSGYNVDTDYIAGIIDTQNYKPDESDFNKIITDVIPLFVPGLVIILFLHFIFRFIKKIF